MNPELKEAILKFIPAEDAFVTEEVQELWSGFGQILRVQLKGAEVASIIVKKIDLSNLGNHPRGWDTDASLKRKENSYRVEQAWYENYASQSDEFSRMPKHLGSISSKNGRVILLEDLDASGFPIRKSSLTIEETKTCILWLASFHAKFMGCDPKDLWEVGTYWHLATRTDEFNKMKDSKLKKKAFKIDGVLNNCKFKTLVHGDAKVANFCFSSDFSKVAAVDFQYVGGGCGIKDVIYLLGSCLSDDECREYEEELLDFYFHSLKKALKLGESKVNFDALEEEWRVMYSIAWTDFTRFLLGWMPAHNKLNSYSTEMIERAFFLMSN